MSNVERISKWFSLREFTFSPTAVSHNIDNTPTKEVIENIRLVATNILDKVRDRFGLVRVTSGYRSKQLNKIIKGSPTSEHLTGNAVDFVVPNQDHYVVASWIRDNLDFNQLILENYTGGDSGWIHVSYRKTGNKRQVLTYKNGKYLNGLIK